MQGRQAAASAPLPGFNDDPSEALSHPPAAHLLPRQQHGHSLLPTAKPPGGSSLPQRCTAAATGPLPSRSGSAAKIIPSSSAMPPQLHGESAPLLLPLRNPTPPLPPHGSVGLPHTCVAATSRGGPTLRRLEPAPPLPPLPQPQDKSSPSRLPSQDQHKASPQDGICPDPADDDAAPSSPPLGGAPSQGDALLCSEDVLPKYGDTVLQMDAIAAQLEVGAPSPVPRAAAPCCLPPSLS